MDPLFKEIRTVTKTTSEEKTTSSETIETHASVDGPSERRIVESETYERRVIHREVIEKGASRLESQHEEVERIPIATTGRISESANVSPSNLSEIPEGWSRTAAPRLKLMLRGCRPAGFAEAEKLDGDYIADLVLQDERVCIWEIAFPAISGFYRALVECRPTEGRFEWQARFEGLDRGPLWSVIQTSTKSDSLQLQSAASPGATVAGIQWPDSLGLVAIPATGPWSGTLGRAFSMLVGSSGSGSGSSGCECPLVVDVIATDGHTIKVDGEFIAPATGEAATITLVLAPGDTCDNITWEQCGGPSGALSGSGCSAAIATLHCGEVCCRAICTCDDSVIWQGIVKVMCPLVARVDVDESVDPATRPGDLEADSHHYFLVPAAAEFATLKATLARPDEVPEDQWVPENWCDAIEWVSENGEQCVGGSISADGCTAVIEYLGKNATYCVTIRCCDESLWEGKVEFYSILNQPCSCSCPPQPNDGSPTAGEGTPGATTPGAYPEPTGTTGGLDPRPGAMSGREGLDWGSAGSLEPQIRYPFGNSLNLNPSGRSSRFSQFDTSGGYGWTSSFNQSIYEVNRDNDAAVIFFAADGARLEFTDKNPATGQYVTPAGSTANLQRTPSGWVLTSVIDNQSWTFDDFGTLSGQSRGAAQWTVTPTVVRGFPLPGVVTDPNGQTLSLSYADEIPPRLTSITDGTGRTTSYGYKDRQLTELTMPDQGTTKFVYDEEFPENLLSKELAGGQRFSFTYDIEQRVASKISPAGRTTSYVYPNASTRVEIDAQGRRKTITYDSQDHITSIQQGGQTWSYGYQNGLPTGYTDPNGNSIAKVYEDVGGGALRLKTVTNGVGQTAIYKYNAAGYVSEIADYSGSRTSFTWDGSGNRKELIDPAGHRVTYVYNSQSQITDINNKQGQQSANTFNGLGNRSAFVKPSGKTTDYTYNTYNQLQTTTTPLGLMTSYDRDAANRLLSKTDPVGATTAYAYDANGLLIRTTNPVGGITTNLYDPDQYPTGIINPLGQQTTYVYDNVGNRVQTINPLGQVTNTRYNAFDLPTASTTPLGHRTTTVYDAGGRDIATVDPLTIRTTRVYDGAGRVIARIDGDGLTTTTTYDADGNVTATMNPLGEINASRFDSLDQVTASINPLGERTTFAYDLAGNQIRSVNPLNQITTTAYDIDDQPIRTIDPLGRITTTVYDDDGRSIATIDPLGNRTTTIYDNASQPISVIDPLGYRTTTVYDLAGRAIEQIDALGNTTATVYNLLGQVVRVIDPLGHITTSLYDDASRLITEIDPLGQRSTTVYDADGRSIRSINPLNQITTTVYDDAGRAVAQINPLGQTSTTVYNRRNLVIANANPLGQITTTVYDDASRTIASINPLGEVSTTIYDSAGRTVATVDPLGYATTTIYDASGQAIASINPLNERTTTIYNAAGQAVVTIDPLLARTTAVYDARGLVIATVDPLNRRSTSTYDAARRLVAETNPENETTQTVYDPAGRPIASIDPLAQRTTTVYDADNRAIATINPLGYVTTTVYDAMGRAIASITPLNERTTTIYNAASQAVVTINPLLARTTSVYDGRGLVIATIDPLNRRSTSTYDAAGRLIAETNPENETTQTVYDAAGRAVATIDPLARRTTTVYDADGRSIATIDALGYAATTVYDASGQAIATINPLNERVTTVYDAASRPIRTTDPLSQITTSVYDVAGRIIATVDPLLRRNTTVYDAAGRVTASIDALTQRTTTSYDAAGRAISVENPLQDVTTSVYDLAGQAVAMVDSLVQRTTTVYDLAGRPIATINPLLQATTTVYDVAGQTIRVIDANGYSTTTVYNAVGLPISIVDARGYRTTTVYDPAERVTAVVNALNQRTTTLYDVAGQKVASIDPLGQRATNIYDAAGEIIAAINPLGQVVTTVYDEAGRIHAVINPLSERTTTSYDAAGRPIVAQNPLNERATTVYDPLGQTISVIDPLGYRTSTIYDAISQRIASVDPRGYRLTFSYDAARQETRQINALGLITSFSYDKVGQRTRQIDPRGVVTTYVFDPANRLTSRADSLGGRVTWTYDNVANPLVIDGATGPYTRTYDPVNQVVTLITGNGDTLQWLRDPLGRRQVLIDPDNGRTTYSYDAVGRMPRLVNSYDEITSFSYDAAGQEIGQVAANSTATTTIYDPAGRIARVAHLDVLASVVDQFDYSYDAAGRRTRVAEESGDVVTWTYDSTGQLLSEARSGANPYRTTYVYDPSGNRLAEETLAGGRTTSVYDSANRLLRSEALSGITTYTYDLAGNRRSLEEPSGDITTYTWNAQNQLIEVELPDSQVLTYVWAPVNKNGEERQVTRDDGIELNQLLWDNNNVLRETDELGTVTADYTYQPQPYGDLLSDHRDTESSFYWFDALGSTTALTDDTGNTTDEYRYTGFGNPTTTSGTSDTPYRWVGQVGYRQDETTGLSNLRARDYDPQTGQFISQDPLGAGLGDSNFYRYVANQPVNLVDPSGLQPYSHLYTQNSVVYADNGYYFDQLVGDLSNLNGTATVARTTSKGRFEVDLSRVFAFADLYWGTVAPGETNTVWYWGSSDWDRWFEKNGVLQTKPSSPASPFLPPSSNFGGLQDTFSTCATVAQEFDKGLSLGYLNLAVAFTWGQSETLNCLRDDQRAQCYGVSDTDQYISVGAATVAREALLATLSGGAAQAAAKGSTGAKFANAAFYIKDGIDAGQQGLQLLQSKSLKEALLNAGLLVIQVASLKGSTGQVLDDGKALCKQFDGTINIKLMPRKYLKPSLDDLKGLDKNANGIVDPSDFPKESLGSLDGRKIYQAPDGSLWACSEVCEKLVAKANAPSSGRPSAKFTHDEYLQKVRPGAKEKTFYPSGKTQGGLGSRRYDDFDPKTKTGYEANTTPWECITAEKLQAKLHQVGSDILLLRNPRSGVKKVIWFGTEELPTSGPAAQLRTALQQAGIKYEVINP